MSIDQTITFSIIMATIRPQKITSFLENINQTASAPNSFEVLIKIDEEDEGSKNALDEIIPNLKFSCRYYILPKLKKYYSLQKAYDYMLNDVATSSKLSWILTDEVRIQTTGWDQAIKKYLTYYNDGVYRLKVNKSRMRNYYHFDECINLPENYPLITFTWLKIVGGWGVFWAPDTWHQCIDYFFGLCRDGLEARFRSMPIYDIDMHGLEPSVSETGGFEAHKYWMNIHGCYILESQLGKENFYRLAHRLFAHTEACKQGHTQYFLCENYQEKTVLAYTCSSDSKKLIYKGNYFLPQSSKSYVLEKLIQKNTIKNAWHQAVREIENRKPFTMVINTESPGLVPSGSQHIEFLLDSLLRN